MWSHACTRNTGESLPYLVARVVLVDRWPAFSKYSVLSDGILKPRRLAVQIKNNPVYRWKLLRILARQHISVSKPRCYVTPP